MRVSDELNFANMNSPMAPGLSRCIADIASSLSAGEFAFLREIDYYDHSHYYSHFNGHSNMQTIQASEFKAKCLALMDKVAATGEGILITKNGKPVAELHPPASLRPKSPFGLHKGQIEIRGDIVSPIDVKWDAGK